MPRASEPHDGCHARELDPLGRYCRCAADAKRSDDLADAIEALLADRIPPTSDTRAIGCFISDLQ